MWGARAWVVGPMSLERMSASSSRGSCGASLLAFFAVTGSVRRRGTTPLAVFSSGSRLSQSSGSLEAASASEGHRAYRDGEPSLKLG